ncbi:nuclear transport factor 2 family protein [Gelidibacter salicanalis]|uniref:Nuclear transport factor 2 family protein n=1 Tax=Gelidibacter salicanalis TaxID=291193 RepID=A0A934KVS3_9FLAO|nr:nuclear transport factor 2 family protein [Gelidibacter salicanalis]MBJ7882905.1 nuclear transport factor 2 family protein [Gelidibacter salicanalis]
MKKTILVVLLLSVFIGYAQKNNGTVYMEHPTIDVVDQFVKASVAGDRSKMGSYLTDDFKAYNGTSNNQNDKGRDKEAFLNNQMVYHDQLDYYAIETYPGSYADAIEYKKDNPDKEVWVQTWNIMKGVQKNTGVKIDAAAHRLYTLTKDNKIKTIIGYDNEGVIDEIRASFADRTNGTIYNHHENINTVRKLMYAMENNDWDKTYSFYDEDVRFLDSSSPTFESVSLEEQKVVDKQILDKFEVTSIDMVGYPDYLHYEMGDARVVQSWWNINLIRKADKKAIILPIHYLMDFNKEGKITSETAYYNAKLLD